MENCPPFVDISLMDSIAVWVDHWTKALDILHHHQVSIDAR